jgi:hypothetical protein
MRFLIIFALAASAFAQKNMVRDRGQTPVQDPTQTLVRGRIGHQDLLPKEPLIVSGMLIDGSCPDRSSLNLHEWPEVAPAPLPNNSSGGVSAKGVTVDAKTLQRERGDVLAHQVPDLRMRQPDPTCAITGSTRSFALLMDNGRLLNLDEGGNTLAGQSLYVDPAGRAMLNGRGPGLKPRIIVEGRIQGDKLIVSKIVKMGGQT